MNKKAIAILGIIFVLIVGTLGFLIYSRYFSEPAQTPPGGVSSSSGNGGSSPAPQPSPAPNATPAPPATPAAANIVRLTTVQVVSPVMFFDGSAINYFDTKGSLFEASLLVDGAGKVTLAGTKQLNIPTKINIEKVYWPAKGKDFIAQMRDSLNTVSFSHFSNGNVSFTDLPPQVTALDWMPSGEQIMYIWLENGKATLSLSAPDTTNYVELAEMWELDNAISVSPNGDQLLYYQMANTGDTNPINSVTSDGKVWKTLVKDGRNFGVLWSPDGKKFLFGKKDTATQKFRLWIYNLALGEVKNLGVNTTVEKAVWDKDSNVIYAAVPTSGNAGENSLTVDSFVRVDTSMGEQKEYPAPAVAVDGRNLFLNNTGDKLFFKNAQDGFLYYLDLKD